MYICVIRLSKMDVFFLNVTAEESGIRIVRGSGYINKEVKLVFVSKGAMKITGILKKLNLGILKWLYES